jgi:hypothetical protein
MNHCLLMSAYRCLLVCLLCSSARAAGAQLTARDTAALVDAVAEQIHVRFGSGIARERFAILPRDTLLVEDVRFTKRVTAAIYARDSSLIVAAPTRSTTRLHLDAPRLADGDSATVPLWHSRCTGIPPVHTYNNETMTFRRAGARWVYIERYSGNGGANPGCPWS